VALGVWRSGLATVEAFMGQANGHDPVVRVIWDDGAGRRTRDLPLELAEDLGEILSILGIRDYSEFAAALRRTARTFDA
jgi:hypothetical protein